uniref:Uncharacterized protein n=1 Tax=Parascaris equorum TaxID=6256 RepID=A0A914RYC9_PAREQ
MKIVAVLAIVSLAWSARQPGKENDAEDQMPETIWIGSPYGLIPYDIDWAYFNKTKEHVLREADKHRKGIKAHPSETTTAALSRKGSNEKHEVNGTLEDILSTTTIEPTTSLQSTTCNDEQEDNVNGQFHTTAPLEIDLPEFHKRLENKGNGANYAGTIQEEPEDEHGTSGWEF